jgi:signal transduction histidine kinase
VHVTIEPDGDRVRLTVVDNGQGFPFNGRMEHAEIAARNAGPVIILDRMAAMCGRLAIESSKTLALGSRSMSLAVPVPVMPAAGNWIAILRCHGSVDVSTHLKSMSSWDR